MIYDVARVRRLSTKFQVDTCKSKEDRSAHAHLVVEIQAIDLQCGKRQEVIYKISSRYIQKLRDRSAHAQFRTL